MDEAHGIYQGEHGQSTKKHGAFVWPVICSSTRHGLCAPDPCQLPPAYDDARRYISCGIHVAWIYDHRTTDRFYLWGEILPGISDQHGISTRISYRDGSNSRP